MEIAIIILAIIITALCLLALNLNKSLKAAKTSETALSIENVRLTERINTIDAGHAAETIKLTERLKTAEERLESVLNDEEKRKAEQKERDEMAELRFKNLATEIFEANTRRFNTNSEEQLGKILSPLRDNIEQFRKTVTESYSNEARERFSLQERIKDLMELNKSIGKEARELTEALRGNSKVQGDWGEMILETILEKSGLKKGLHFTVQQTTDCDGNTLKNERGNYLRPDVVVNYPDGRCMVIDSKVSLTAYVNLVNAENSAQAENFGKQHLNSVRQHIRELADKNYQEYVGDKKTDFVMMFIPNEAAYLTAMNLAPDLWQEAYDKRVIIISPTHLISALKLVEQLWRQDDIKRNVLSIADESGKMYDKFVGFVDDLQKIRKSFDSTSSMMDEAMKKLKTGTGNLIRRAENIKKMGAKATKALHQSMTDTEE